MAAFDGIDMRITAGGGAVVELSAVLGESPLEYAADPRGDVVVPAGGHVAVVRGIDCSDGGRAMAVARELTEGALNQFITQQSARQSVVSSNDSAIAWWVDETGSTIRVTGAPTWTPVSPTWGDTRRSAFEVQNAYPASDTPWHVALKHYRASETTAEVERSAADLYLALASALGARVRKLPHESERHWLLRSLRVVDREVGLSPFAPHEGHKSVPDAIHDELCRVLRSPRPNAVLRPLGGGRPSHSDMVAARARYATMFRQLARVYVGITFPSLEPSESTFDTTVRSRLERSVVWIGDQRAAGLDAARSRVGEWHPAGARLRLPTRDEEGITADGRFAVVGRTTANAVEAGVGVIRSFGTLEDERVTSVANLAGALDVRDATSVEIVVYEPR